MLLLLDNEEKKDKNTMAPTNKKQKLSREEILQKKREAEKARLSRIRNDPVKLAEYKEKERLRYLKKKRKGAKKKYKRYDTAGTTYNEKKLERVC